MVGRSAQGKPWLFREINHFIETGSLLPSPTLSEKKRVVLNHLHELYQFYGEENGVRIARKHVTWYSAAYPQGAFFRQQFNQLTTVQNQKNAVQQFYDQLIQQETLTA